MSREDYTRELFERCKCGDNKAFQDLLHDNEELLLCIIKKLVRRSMLFGVIEATDIVQLTFESFIRKLRDSLSRIATPKQFSNWLVTIAKRRVCDQERLLLRELRHQEAVEMDWFYEVPDPVAGDDEAFERVSRQELCDLILSLMTEKERRVAWLWMLDYTWSDIGVAQGESPAALRQVLRRAIERIRLEFASACA